MHDGWDSKHPKVLTDFLQLYHICKYILRLNKVYKSMSHIANIPGCGSCCIRNRRMGYCRRSKVHGTLRQGKSLNEIECINLKRAFQTKEVVSPEVDTSALELNIYTSVLYAFLVIAGFFVVVSFFGCCGAWKVTMQFKLLENSFFLKLNCLWLFKV